MRKLPLSLSLLLSPLTAAAAPPPEPADLLAALAQPAPAQTRYFERRSSPLLATPLLFGGELSQPTPGELIKTVEGDAPERMRIAGERVEVERAGQPSRRFSLKRAPELAALSASFEALLRGDLALLQRHYRLEMQGEAAAWTLRLEPLDRRLRKRVIALELRGVELNWRCFDLRLDGAEDSRMWLGEVAAPAAAAGDETRRDALCAAAAGAP